MAIRKHFDERRLALAISRLIDTVEEKVKANSLSVEDALKALHAIGQLVPAYVKLLESVGMSDRLSEVEDILKKQAR